MPSTDVVRASVRSRALKARVHRSCSSRVWSSWPDEDVLYACRCAVSDSRFDIESEAMSLVGIARRDGRDINAAAKDVEIGPRQLSWLRLKARQGGDPIAQIGIERMASARLKVAQKMRMIEIRAMRGRRR